MIKYYPFELHCHTVHSDGKMTPKILVESAKERGLSGIAITDHNTVSAAEEVYCIGKKYALTVIKGIEWTTFYGHLTVLGGNSKVNWRDITPENITGKIREAVKAGDIVNIAHAKRMGSPVCTGCYMEYKISDLNLISGYEVWSNPKPSFNKTNENALSEYDGLCAEGYKIAALYGDDWHDPKNNAKQYAVTYLGIEGGLNEKNAVQAIKNRNTYISTGLTAGITVQNGSGAFNIGDIIKPGVYNIQGKTDNGSDYCVKRGVTAEEIVIKGTAAENKSYKIVNNAIDIKDLKINKGYIRFEIRGRIEGAQTTLLLTSPLYAEE